MNGKNFTEVYSTKEDLDPKVLKIIDTKMDDGTYNSGKIRGNCAKDTTSYDNAIADKEKCMHIYQIID